VNGEEFSIKRNMFTFRTFEKTVQVEEFVPSVIEPSFGIGRIMYSVWEHNFHIRPEDEQRTVRTKVPSSQHLFLFYLAVLHIANAHCSIQVRHLTFEW
jgi:glycyl-tRNA synthetase (class II)